MSVLTSIKGVAEFATSNQDLVKDILATGKEAVEQVKGLAQRVDALRADGQELAPMLDVAPFDVARADAVRQQQQTILARIDELNKLVTLFQDSPQFVGPLHTQLSMQYMALANTMVGETISRIVRFTPEEVEELNGLLKQATLDAERRQRWADVLNAAVQLTKFGIKVAAKLAV